MRKNELAEEILRKGEARGRAYADAVCRYNDTVQTYEEYRGAKVFTFRPGLYVIHTEGEAGQRWSFLREGAEEALLIDPVGDMSGLCARLVGAKRVTVHSCSGGVFSQRSVALGAEDVLEILPVAGLLPGASAVLDRKNRILFTGEALCSDFTLIRGRVSDYAESLRSLLTVLDQADWIFPCRGTLEFESYVVNDALAGAEEILAEPRKCSYTALNANGDELRFKICMAPGTIVYGGGSAG